ncbi:MAG: hypothetical protein IPH53_17940 [Flavobacteriales bacterium]|nr:hypothetical protein [Flavobacteriales bacterium]
MVNEAPSTPPAVAPFRPERPVEFEVVNKQPAAPVSDDKKVHALYDDAPPASVNTTSADNSAQRLPPAEHQARVEERLSRMRDLTLRLRSPNGINDLEREPAYIRKRVTLTEGPRSTDSSVSRYTLSEDQDESGERRVELKKNNPFLHDNVD